MDGETLLEKAKEYLPADKLALVKAAYEFASRAHEGQVRKTGEPFLEHPVQTAMILAGLQLDATTLAAALLHDVLEDCGVPLSEVEAKFGPEVSRLVDGTTKLGKLSWKGDGESRQESQVQNLRKMLLAMAQDLRVVFIKLADRLHNMRTLGVLAPEKRKQVAQETLEVYAPLAHRLGIWQLKWQLEDLAFRYLEPREYHRIARMVATKRAQRESFINEVVQILRQELERAEIKADVFGRPKHIYSIYDKMKRYAAQGRDFNDIHDLFAVRILVHTEEESDCYKALGVVHNLWHPIPEEFNDFIANPKDNGYKSLHTTVMCKGTTPLEIQIRTYKMHETAEFGLAAHWRYKEGGKKEKGFEDKIAWLRQLIEWQSELSSEEFMESLRTELLLDQVFVFTPKGEIISLPKGATPLDFAYRIHTELGHRCIGAKVNGKLVPLNYELKSGEIVGIMTTKADRGPSMDWLNPDLGFVKTPHAREKIRQWFKKQERAQNIERGREILERELKRLGVTISSLEEIARQFNYSDPDDFLAAIGYGGITPHQLALKLVAEPVETSPVVKPSSVKAVSHSGIQVLGVGDLLSHLANCCHPVPGDNIIGYITRNRGVSVHRQDCINIQRVEDKRRLIEVSWGKVQKVYPVDIQIDAWDRVGLLRDITTIVADAKVNIAGISTEYHDDIISVFATLEIANMAELTHLLSRIQGVRGVISAVRTNSAKVSLGG